MDRSFRPLAPLVVHQMNPLHHNSSEIQAAAQYAAAVPIPRMLYFFYLFSPHFMTSSSLACYHGVGKRQQAMGARGCKLVDTAGGKSKQATQEQRGRLVW